MSPDGFLFPTGGPVRFAEAVAGIRRIRIIFDVRLENLDRFVEAFRVQQPIAELIDPALRPDEPVRRLRFECAVFF